MTSRSIPWAVMLALVVSACSSARPANGTGGPDGSHSPGADGGDSDGGEPEPDGAVPDAGSPDTTCPTPSSPFAVDLPPPPAAHTTRRRAAVQVVAGTVRAYSSDFYQNGSFYNASFVQHARGATGWSQSSIAGGGIGSSVARSMATSHGPDACVAWSYDYTGELHLQCASLPDRTLAPRITGSLSLAEHAGHKHLVYQAPGGLVHQVFDGEVQPASPVYSGAWSYGPTALAVAANGDLHLAFVTLASNNGRAVHYGRRQGLIWTLQSIDTDTWSGSSSEGDTVAIALAGGVPRIAYHHRATKSLKLAELDAAGNVSLRTLIAPDPAFSNDVVGQSIALASDCGGRLHVVYQRRISTDAQPNLLLAYARITATGLEHKQFLPMTSSTAYQHYADAYGLDFYLAPDGKQYVAAQLNSIFGHGLYVATR